MVSFFLLGALQNAYHAFQRQAIYGRAIMVMVDQRVEMG